MFFVDLWDYFCEVQASLLLLTGTQEALRSCLLDDTDANSVGCGDARGKQIRPDANDFRSRLA